MPEKAGKLMDTETTPLTAEQERVLLLNARAIEEANADSFSETESLGDPATIERLQSESASLLRAYYGSCKSIDEFIEHCSFIDLFRLMAEAEARDYKDYAAKLHRTAELLTVAITRASNKTKAEVIELLTGSSELTIKVAEIGGKLARSHTARKAAIASHTKHSKRASKQEAKAGVREWWERWQSDPSMYKSKAAFARIMCDKYSDELESTQVIERWCTEWQRNRPPE